MTTTRKQRRMPMENQNQTTDRKLEEVEDTSLRARFPMLDKLLRCNDPVKGWAKFLWGIYFLPSGIGAVVIDIICLCVVKCLEEAGRIWRKIIDIVIEKFIGKLLLIAAIAISSFFIFFLIKSGTWQNLFDFCSELLG